MMWQVSDTVGWTIPLINGAASIQRFELLRPSPTAATLEPKLLATIDTGAAAPEQIAGA